MSGVMFLVFSSGASFESSESRGWHVDIPNGHDWLVPQPDAGSFNLIGGPFAAAEIRDETIVRRVTWWPRVRSLYRVQRT